MQTSGRLSDVSFPVLLRSLQRDKMTGILTVSHNGKPKHVYFQNGDMVFASSRYEDDRLGEMLLKWGKITYTQYEQSVVLLKKTGKRQGAILVEQGYITAKELFHSVTAQVKEIILSLFSWLDGDYAFDARPLPTDEVIKLRMSTGSLLYEGIQRIDDFSLLRRTLPAFDTVVTISTDPRDLFQPVEVTQEEREFLLLVDGYKTIGDLVRASALQPLHTVQMLHFLLAAGIVQVKPAEAVAAESQEDSKRRIELELESIISEAITRKKQEEAESARVELFEEFRPGEEVLGPDRIKQAFESLEGKNFYELLGLDSLASVIEIKKAYFRLAKAYHPDRHHRTGMEALRQMLEVLFDRLTHAYDTLINEKSRHDYDLAQALSHAPPQPRKAPADPKAREQQAAEQCKIGEAALIKGKVKEAVNCLEWAVQLDGSTSRYHALLGQALANVPGRQKSAESELQTAIGMEPANGDYYVVLGLLYLKVKNTKKAITQFEEALKWDPRNKKAKDQLTWLKSQ